jgi:hypothetical protein
MSTLTLLSDVIELSDDLEAFNDYAIAQGWSDGLPLIPPTEARVERMLQGYERTSASVIAHLPVEDAPCSIEKIAVNAVMAGCKPGYMPLLIATVQAVADPAFNLTGIQATTNPVAPMLIVNGPIRHQLEINSSYGCFGPGWQANATIGRALRLLLINVGGAIPGVQDMSVMGQPGKYTMCVGEHEEASPWEPLHVERGLQPTQSAVTVVGVSGCFNILGTRRAAAMVREIARALGHVGSNDYRFAGQPLCALNPTHAESLANSGYDKAQLKQALFELAKRPVREFSSPRFFEPRSRELGDDLPDDRLIALTEHPEDVLIIVAGGSGAGVHNLCIPSFGNTRAVTVAVT